MAYPQISADVSLLQGLPFFRLNEAIVSPGDIYESTQGAQAFALGPDSDISQVVIVYYDPTLGPTFMNRLTLGPDRSLASLIAADNLSVYQPVINSADPQNQRPGRILIYPAEIFDPTFRPQNAAGADTVAFIQPHLDVIQFFKNPGALSSRRTDRVFFFPLLPAPPNAGANVAYMVVPYYGRKYAHISALGEAGEPTTLTVIGINYQPATNNVSGLAFETELFPPTSIDEVDATNIIITAGNQGCFDALVLGVGGGGEVGIPQVRIVMSDTPAATP